MDQTISIEKMYQKKTQLEHILLRPDSYVGSIVKTNAMLWILEDGSEKFTHKEIEYVPGLYKIFDEILVNAADNYQRGKNMDTIKVTIDEEKGLISVWNNGSGIPVQIHKEYDIYVPELIFGHLLTSSNYDDTQKKVTGGRNGYGAKLTNIFSKKFIVETADSKSKKSFKMTWRNNMSNSSSAQINSHSGEDYTCISFEPDLPRFQMDHLEKDTVALMRKRVYDLAGVISSNVRVYLNGKKIPIKGFQQYVDMYIPENALKIREKSENERWEVIVSVSEGQFQQVSFVNSICTSDGGTHVKYISEQIIDKLIETIQKKHKDLNIKPFQVKHHIWVFINSLIENPAFSSQTKESLTTKASQFGSKCDLSEKFLKSLLKSAIIDQVIASAKAKTDSKLAKALSGTKKSRLLGIDKLEDANDAGTRNAEGCTLILTEGDSAKALAMSGIEVVGRDKYGVFPLKGKFLNVREAAATQIMKNEEVQNLIKIMGLQVGKEYNDKKSLRYGSVMIMADQDADGSHIKGLIINFVHHFWPSLTKMSGFLRQFITPIIKATKGKNASQEKVFFTLQEFRRWADQIGTQVKSWKIKYYKGLGTSTDKEAKEYFNAIGRHQIDFEYVDQQDDDSLSMAFSKKMANARKEWLANYDPEVEIDYNQREIRYQDFINKELIHFSNYDNIRAIPSVCDGFKPGQRKIMFSLFNRKSKEDAKVAQLSGYVAAYSAYHHGEQSLASTIVGLAQTFVGSNNINLLMPVGQFGSRNAGGKDAASSRYIFTNVSKVTRHLFPPPDDHLLKYLDDDGQSVEPEWYIPIIPLVLVNGSEGIGTGWSTSIPCYNPYELVENMKRKLRGEEFKPMHPWYKGYCGEIEQTEKGGYIIRGKYDITDDDTIEITEIPVTKWWTRDYKKFLEGMVNPEEGEPEIDDMKEYHANDRVHFIIKMREGKLAKLSSREDVEKKFKLTTQMQTTNMVLFNAERKLKKYDKVEEIMQEFYDTRLKFYGKRKDYLMSKLQRDIEIMTNKKRFILAVIAEDINIRNVKKKLLIQELLKKGYTPMKNMTKIKSTKKQETKVEGDDAQQEGEEEKENAEEQSEDDQTISPMEFNYLLSMPIWSLTYEKVEELKKQLKNTEEELTSLQKVKIEDMWLDDLDKFVCVLKEVEEEQEQERMKGPKAKGGGKMIKKKPKKKKVESSDDEHNKSKIEESAKKGAKDKDTSMILETAKKPAKKKAKKDDDEMEEEKKAKPKQKEGKDKDKDKDKDKEKEKEKEKDKKNKENEKKPEKEEEEKKNSILKYLNTPSFKDKEKENTKKRHREEEDDDEKPFLSLTDRLRLREQKGDIKTFHSAYENVKNQYLGDFDEESQTRAELIDNRPSKKNEEKENQSSFGELRVLKKARMDLSDEDPVKSEKVSIKFNKVSVSKSNVSQNSMSEILMSKQKGKDEYKREKRSTTAKKKTVFSSDEDDNYGSDDDDFQPEETYY